MCTTLPTILFCLIFVLNSVCLIQFQIKLQMDPRLSDESLQKTHHHQLQKLTTLTEELVKTLQNLQVSSPVLSLPQTNATIAEASAQPSSVSPRLAFPEKYDGNPTQCKGFLLQCTLFVNQQPALYSTEEARISFVCSLLTGKALEWMTAVWRGGRSPFPTFTDFLQRFREVFDHSKDGRSADEQLLTLSQGRRTAAEYAMSFRTLAAQTTWTEDPLKVHFRKGLNHDLQTELACRDEGKTLDQFIDITIQIDNLLRSQRPSTRAPSMTVSDSHEPMQVDTYHISSEERDRRINHRLCLYCGEPGHIRISCPARSRRDSTTRVSVPILALNIDNCITVPVTLTLPTGVVSVRATLDSGAAGNFMSLDFACECSISLIQCLSPLTVEAVDGRPLGTGEITHLTWNLT